MVTLNSLPQTNNNMLIKCINVGKTYQLGSFPVEAVKKINLAVKPGEFVAIMGPSGSGKSTLMNLLGLLDKPTTGQIFFEDEDVSKISEIKQARLRNKGIGFIFQNYNLLPRVSALENVKLPLIYSPEKSPAKRQEMAVEALKKVGLAERLDHKPNQMSGGQQQRVAIARALVNQPRLILADEPTGSLDTKTGKEIMKILTDLNKEGKTIIMITHEIDIAKYAKRTVRLIDGEVRK